MPRPWRIRYAGAMYHVTVRGNGRRDVFKTGDDYVRFLMQLDDALEKDGVVLYAYALLSNHYHLFIETPFGNIQRFMQRLNTAYSMYHRYKHSAPGHCFQGRYGAKLVSGKTYIAALTRYIHLNPIKTKANARRRPDDIINDLNEYPWSSYRSYISSRDSEDRVNLRWLELMGCTTRQGNRQAYRRYVERFIAKDDAGFLEAMQASRYAIGDSDFVKEVEADLLKTRKNKGVYGDIVWPQIKHPSLDNMAKIVADEFGIELKDLKSRTYAARIAKKVTAELGCRYCGESQRTVGEYLGYTGNGSVAKQRQRLREILKDDKKLRRKVHRIEKLLAAG